MKRTSDSYNKSALLLLSAFAVALLAGSAEAQWTTVELGDCGVAGVPLPSQAQCTAACSGVGDCPADTYNWVTPPDTAVQRCQMNPISVAGTFTGWDEHSVGHQGCTDDDCCDGVPPCTGGLLGCSITVDEKIYDSYTVSGSVSYSVGAKAGINAAIVASVEISAETEFTAGAQFTSSREVGVTYQCGVDAPCCGKKKLIFGIWKRTWTGGSCTATFAYQGLCRYDGDLCDGSNWKTVSSTNATIPFGAGDSDTSAECKKCTVYCGPDDDDVAPECDGSATVNSGDCTVPNFPEA